MDQAIDLPVPPSDSLPPAQIKQEQADDADSSDLSSLEDTDEDEDEVLNTDSETHPAQVDIHNHSKPSSSTSLLPHPSLKSKLKWTSKSSIISSTRRLPRSFSTSLPSIDDTLIRQTCTSNVKKRKRHSSLDPYTTSFSTLSSFHNETFPTSSSARRRAASFDSALSISHLSKRNKDENTKEMCGKIFKKRFQLTSSSPFSFSDEEDAHDEKDDESSFDQATRVPEDHLTECNSDEQHKQKQMTKKKESKNKKKVKSNNNKKLKKTKKNENVDDIAKEKQPGGGRNWAKQAHVGKGKYKMVGPLYHGKKFDQNLIDYIDEHPESNLVRWSKCGTYLLIFDLDGLRKEFNKAGLASQGSVNSLIKQLKNYSFDTVSFKEIEKKGLKRGISEKLARMLHVYKDNRKRGPPFRNQYQDEVATSIEEESEEHCAVVKVEEKDEDDDVPTVEPSGRKRRLADDTEGKTSPAKKSVCKDNVISDTLAQSVPVHDFPPPASSSRGISKLDAARTANRSNSHIRYSSSLNTRNNILDEDVNHDNKPKRNPPRVNRRPPIVDEIELDDEDDSVEDPSVTEVGAENRQVRGIIREESSLAIDRALRALKRARSPDVALPDKKARKRKRIQHGNVHEDVKASPTREDGVEEDSKNSLSPPGLAYNVSQEALEAKDETSPPKEGSKQEGQFDKTQESPLSSIKQDEGLLDPASFVTDALLALQQAISTSKVSLAGSQQGGEGRDSLLEGIEISSTYETAQPHLSNNVNSVIHDVDHQILLTEDEVASAASPMDHKRSFSVSTVATSVHPEDCIPDSSKSEDNRAHATLVQIAATSPTEDSLKQSASGERSAQAVHSFYPEFLHPISSPALTPIPDDALPNMEDLEEDFSDDLFRINMPSPRAMHAGLPISATEILQLQARRNSAVMLNHSSFPTITSQAGLARSDSQESASWSATSALLANESPHLKFGGSSVPIFSERDMNPGHWLQHALPHDRITDKMYTLKQPLHQAHTTSNTSYYKNVSQTSLFVETSLPVPESWKAAQEALSSSSSVSFDKTASIHDLKTPILQSLTLSGIIADIGRSGARGGWKDHKHAVSENDSRESSISPFDTVFKF